MHLQHSAEILKKFIANVKREVKKYLPYDKIFCDSIYCVEEAIFMNEIFMRTSVRQFEAREVEPEKIQAILRAGFSAPSALNQREWEFFVVTNRETLQALSKTSPYAGTVAKAPAAIVICYRNNIKALDFAHIDCAVANFSRSAAG